MGADRVFETPKPTSDRAMPTTSQMASDDFGRRMESLAREIIAPPTDQDLGGGYVWLCAQPMRRRGLTHPCHDALRPVVSAYSALENCGGLSPRPTRARRPHPVSRGSRSAAHSRVRSRSRARCPAGA